MVHLVPAHAGGVDLSLSSGTCSTTRNVPAHAGGVDLSSYCMEQQMRILVPAHAGGVDLSCPPLFLVQW